MVDHMGRLGQDKPAFGWELEPFCMGRLGQDKPAFGWELEPFWPLLLPIDHAHHFRVQRAHLRLGAKPLLGAGCRV